MKIEVSNEKIDNIKADCEFIIVLNKDLDHKWVKDKEDLETLSFEGVSEEVAFLPHQHRVYVGVDSLDRDEIRLALSMAINKIKKASYKIIKIASYIKDCPFTNVKAVAEGIVLGNYVFDKYKSSPEKKIKRKLIISLDEYSDKTLGLESAQKAIDEAIIIAQATNRAKDIVNSVPDDMTPKKLAKVAKKIADENDNVKVFIGGKEFLKKEKMGAFLAVSRASVHKPQLIHLVYKPKNARKRFVFVGKGLTYDSGGLSLKPSEHMVTMKADKSGAATVLSVLEGAVKLKVPFEIHAIVGACENMIGGNAFKPDDILVAKNGTTIEVRNTDAEGRLVLADCLCYACEQKPDYLVDMATLTGACVVAVGEYTTGVMGHNSHLKHNLLKATKNSGELASTLQFNRYLKKTIKSQIADISNISSTRYGGAITAAMFLDNFVADEYKDKWMHFDIAGPAYVEKDWGYNQAGASGAGVRMSLYWLKEEERKNNKKDIHHEKKEK